MRNEQDGSLYLLIENELAQSQPYLDGLAKPNLISHEKPLRKALNQNLANSLLVRPRYHCCGRHPQLLSTEHARRIQEGAGKQSFGEPTIQLVIRRRVAHSDQLASLQRVINGLARRTKTEETLTH